MAEDSTYENEEFSMPAADCIVDLVERPVSAKFGSPEKDKRLDSLHISH